jgi:hypothetical protein
MAVGWVVDPLAAAALAGVRLEGIPQPRAPRVDQEIAARIEALRSRDCQELRGALDHDVADVMKLLLEFSDAIFQRRKLRNRDQLREHRLERRQPDRLPWKW